MVSHRWGWSYWPSRYLRTAKLVSAASKYGATSEIAQEIGNTLRETLSERGGLGGNDVVVDVVPSEQVTSVEDYNAVVLGSAVYAGHWLESARELAERLNG